ADRGSCGERGAGVGWVGFVLRWGGRWLLYLHRYSWGVIKPDFKAENPHLTDVDLGWLDSAFLATYAFGQVPGGVAGDLLGARIVLGVSIFLWSLTVVALPLCIGFWGLFGMRSAFGLAQAGAYPAMSKVTRSWFPAGVRTSVQGTVAAMGRVGGACASTLIATLLISRLGLSWRAALVVIALPGVLLAVVFWAVFRDSPREHPWTNRAEREGIEAGSPPAVARTRAALRLDRSIALSLVMLLLYAFFSTFADQLYVFWIPSFLVEGKELRREAMGWFAPLALLGGALGGVVGGALNDLFLRR